ncbi:LacI family DNA-binding transcriptional regulator [Propionimicrobium sp. PCR01-08-3]|nr:LacI family DNA-binding transcriptional regulator [Propionimicrobium sp. PCR01-08-3]WIY81698.1 LacI family DNA-binding transcriptional regulator [Propionimicrobium sp. PCR01-08-3]
MQQRATIIEVAHRAGVAPSTVSRAFNKPRMLRPETVRRIMAIAAELGYEPNVNARALSTGKSGMFGLVVPDITNPFFAPLIRAAQRAAENEDLDILVVESDSDPERELRLVRRLMPRVAGFLLASSRLSERKAREITELARVVFINRDIAGTARVLTESSESLKHGVAVLADGGARHIAYVGGPRKSWSETERSSTVIEAAREFDIAITHLRVEAGIYRDARALTPEIVRIGADAVVAFDDILAHGVLDGLRHHGIDVPAHVQLLGCDDALPIETHPSISTIRLRSEEAAVIAIRLLIGDDGDAVSSARIGLQGVLELRETTRG